MDNCDFSSFIGSLLDGEQDDLLGSWGVGPRNGCGRWFVQWILSNGLRVAGRQNFGDATEGWTCKRSSDGMFAQTDFMLPDVRASVVAFMIRLGIDHEITNMLQEMKP